MVRSGHDCELLEADNELEVEVATGRSMLFASMSQVVRNDTDKPVFYLKEGRRVIFISPSDSDSPGKLVFIITPQDFPDPDMFPFHISIVTSKLNLLQGVTTDHDSAVKCSCPRAFKPTGSKSTLQLTLSVPRL